jgi:hypothetical protein
MILQCPDRPDFITDLTAENYGETLFSLDLARVVPRQLTQISTPRAEPCHADFGFVLWFCSTCRTAQLED